MVTKWIMNFVFDHLTLNSMVVGLNLVGNIWDGLKACPDLSWTVEKDEKP